MSENHRRFDWDAYGIFLAFAASTRASCPKKRVGCVLMDKSNNVIATGYNGSRRGEPHCDEVRCKEIDGHCISVVHAENNSLNRAEETSRYHELKDGKAFVTIRPCNNRHCFDNLIAAGIKYICYFEEYKKDEVGEYQERVCREMGVVMKKFEMDDLSKLFQRAIDFHQGPGGLLIGRNKLTIEEYIPDMMDH